jgi:hypothetical protein
MHQIRWYCSSSSSSPDRLELLHQNLPIMRQFLFRVIIIFTFLGVCYCLCLLNIAFFYKLLYKAGVSLGVRALSFFLIKLGCSVGLLAAAILFALKTLAEDPSVENKMLPGDASSGASTSNQGQSAMGGPIPASTSQPATPEVPQDALWNDPDQPRRSEANRPSGG